MTQTQTTPTPQVQAYVILAIGVISVSMSAIFIRLALGEGVPTLVIVASRLVLATLVLTPFTLQRYSRHLRALHWRDFGLLSVSGVFLALHFTAWVSSLQYTTVLIAAVLVTTTPIWVAFLEVFLLKARLSTLVIIGLVISLIGGILIAIPTGDTGMGSNPLLGGAFALSAAMFVTVYMIIGRKYRPVLPLLPYIWVVYGTAALVMLGVVALAGLSFTGYSSNAYLWLLMVTIFPQLLGHSSLNYALGFLSATVVSIATQAEPIFSAIVAYFLFSESPGVPQIIGSVIILIGVTIATLNPAKPPQEIKQEQLLESESL
ncbi:MAG: DMT family transporter [Anaerolineae bacterium]|jgi:drug/metabolite transporter (DMT)-like permease|nr:DMT family transporter [Anaerolineae bacterium]